MRHPYAIFFEALWDDPPRRPTDRDDDDRRRRWTVRQRRRWPVVRRGWRRTWPRRGDVRS